MKYSLSEAAKATGKNKTTIQRAIKSGKISASKGNGGSYEIDPSELHRVFPPTVAQRDAQHMQSNDTQQAKFAPESSYIDRVVELEKELAVAHERANGLEAQELIAHVSSRLIVNKASMKMQHARIQALIDTLRDAVESR